jgi:hypothetical protein
MTHGGATPRKKRPRKIHRPERRDNGIDKPVPTDPNPGATNASPPGQAFRPEHGHHHHHHHRPKPDEG